MGVRPLSVVQGEDPACHGYNVRAEVFYNVAVAVAAGLSLGFDPGRRLTAFRIRVHDERFGLIRSDR